MFQALNLDVRDFLDATQYLRRIKRGEEIIVTERERPCADREGGNPLNPRHGPTALTAARPSETIRLP